MKLEIYSDKRLKNILNDFNNIWTYLICQMLAYDAVAELYDFYESTIIGKEPKEYLNSNLRSFHYILRNIFYFR